MDAKRPYSPSEEHVLRQPEDEQSGRLYRLKDGYCLRSFCGEDLVIPVSQTAISENQVAVISPVGKFLWELLQTEQTFSSLLMALLDEYDVPMEQAAQDVKEFLLELDTNHYLRREKENE